MKKEELKAELSKVNPSEELIQKTLLRMEEAKEKKETTFLSMIKGFRYKTAALATACCALVLVAGLGLMTGKHDKGNPGVESRIGEEAEFLPDTNLQIAAYDGETLDAPMWEKGELLSFSFREVTPEESENGVIACGILEIGQETDTVKEAEMFFYDNAELERLTEMVSNEIYFALSEENAGEETLWRVTEVSLEEIK